MSAEESSANMILVHRKYMRLIMTLLQFSLLFFVLQGCQTSYYLIEKNDSHYLEELKKYNLLFKKEIIFLGFHWFHFSSELLNSAESKDVKKCLKLVNEESISKYQLLKEKFPFMDDNFHCYHPNLSVRSGGLFGRQSRHESSLNEIVPIAKVKLEKNKLEEITRLLLKDSSNLFYEDFMELFSIQNKEIFFNLRDVDYYVIGINKPVFHENTTRGLILKYITLFPFLLSLGILPVTQEIEISSSYYIFDKNLNKLYETQFPKKYWIVTTILPIFSKKKYESYFILYSNNANKDIVFRENFISFKKAMKEFCEKNEC